MKTMNQNSEFGSGGRVVCEKRRKIMKKVIIIGPSGSGKTTFYNYSAV